MTSEEKVQRIFGWMLELTGNEQLPAAILTACVVGQDLLQDLDHKLCLGLRYGLYGIDANDRASILNISTDLIDGLESLGFPG